MKEEQPVKNIEPKDLVSEADALHKGGFRLIHICCTKIADEEKFELTYAFDKESKYESLRITVPTDSEIPSISSACKGAYLFENEIRELFGANITGISFDFRGNLYKKKVEKPFCTPSKVDTSCQKG